jgi:division protein CdvB (Snf7/Vps24/ESCRT-III family)
MDLRQQKDFEECLAKILGMRHQLAEMASDLHCAQDLISAMGSEKGLVSGHEVELCYLREKLAKLDRLYREAMSDRDALAVRCRRLENAVYFGRNVYAASETAQIGAAKVQNAAEES